MQRAKINNTQPRVCDTNEISTYLIKKLKQMAENRQLGDDRHVKSRYAIEKKLTKRNIILKIFMSSEHNCLALVTILIKNRR